MEDKFEVLKGTNKRIRLEMCYAAKIVKDENSVNSSN